MALAMAIVVTLITIVSVLLFGVHAWKLPVDIARLGPPADHQFMLTLAITGFFFVAAQLGLALFVWKYHDKKDNRKVTYSHGNNTLEKLWTTAGAVIFIGLNLLGYHIWAQTHFTGATPGALRIEVWGQQFQYTFRYPGADGQFGPVHIDKVDDAIGNYLGLDRDHDAASKDDILTETLGVPVDRQVELLLRSKDVIHSFYVRELRLQQDIVPGMTIPIHFTATQTGTYEIVCTQLCGLGHYKMRAFLKVMTEPDYEKWLQEQAATQ
jgi:cytochrome c oxidase subunit II